MLGAVAGEEELFLVRIGEEEPGSGSTPGRAVTIRG